MPPTRQEFLHLVQQESLGRPYQTSVDTALGMIKTAAVSFEHLTNDPNWDRFLSYVQAKLDEAKKEREQWLSHCGHVGEEASLRHSQMQYNRFDAVVKVLEEVMGLPIQLQQTYQEVKK